MQQFYPLFNLAILLFLPLLSQACYPSRSSYGYHRALREPPFVVHQHFPNSPESHMTASGPSEGRIIYKDERYNKELVRNYNPDIVFKDEEGDGEDRVMTRRLVERLDTLALLVMNRWPGTLLRVTEAWDQKLFHPKDSLHYEGRAVDINTSDQDKHKYGMLARLAVRAGFDYVSYENKAHIHASVKSDKVGTSGFRGCFSLSETVRKADDSQVALGNLEIGDVVEVVDGDGNIVFSPIVMFLDRNSEENVEFITIHTKNKKSLTLTPNHILPRIRDRNYSESSLNEMRFDSQSLNELAFASELLPGDFIWTLNNSNIDKNVKHNNNNNNNFNNNNNNNNNNNDNSNADSLDPPPILLLDRVVKVTKKVQPGYIAPLTAEGTIVVNGVAASCFASYKHTRVAQAAFFPVRVAHRLWNLIGSNMCSFSSLCPWSSSTQSQGVHWYAAVLEWVGSELIGLEIV